MRVVQYHPRALVGDGGISNSVRSLSAAMARAGASPVIVHAEGPQRSPAGDVQWVGLPHNRVGPAEVPRHFARALADADVLVLNSAWTAYNVRAGRVARALGVPYVVADRGAYDPLILQRRRRAKAAWWAAFERRLVMGAAALHLFFESQQAPLRQLGYHGPVVVAPNGVHLPEQWRWDGGSGGYLLYVGRFDPEHKGLDLLVRAVDALPANQRPQVRLHGPDWRGGKAQTEALVATLGLQDHVQIGAPVYGDDKWALMSAARGFVYPSRWEGFGNAPVEAAGIGVPVLATPYPLGRYLADHGAGLLAQPTVESLADGLVQLSEASDELGQRGAALIAAEFSWDAVARSWLEQLDVLT